MRFTKLRLVGASNVDLPILGADPSGPFLLKGADGLGPPEIDVKIANTVQEGGVYQGRRAQNRQPVIRVGLQPEWDVGQTAEELRTILYGLLTPKFGQLVQLELYNVNTHICKAQGHLSRFEAAIFTENPEVQITLECDHPYLLAPVTMYQIPAETVSGTQTLLDVANSGTAPSGFVMGVTFTAPAASPIQISDENSTGAYISVAGTWAAGDTLKVDTRGGSRGVWKIPAGGSVPISVLNDLSAGSTWLELHGGVNRLRLNKTAFDWYVPIGFSHTPAYWGV